MAKRYIGDAVVTILYVGTSPDNRETYKGTITAGGRTWKFDDLNSGVGGFQFASDSPQAFDEMASSAVSFASYYAQGNRGDEPDWAPDEETADAIASATEWAQDEDGSGEYEVRRKPSAAKGTHEGARMGASRMRSPEAVDDPEYIIRGVYNDGSTGGGFDSHGFDDEAVAIAEAKKIARSNWFEADYVEVITRDGELVWRSDDGAQETSRTSTVGAGQRKSAAAYDFLRWMSGWTVSEDVGDGWLVAYKMAAVQGEAPGEHICFLRQETRMWHAFYRERATGSGSTPRAALTGRLGDVIGSDREMRKYCRLVLAAPRELVSQFDGLYEAQSQCNHEDENGDDEDLDEAPRGRVANSSSHSERYSTRQSTENALIYDVLIDRHHKIGYITGPFSYGGKRDFYRWRLDSVSPNGFPPFGLSSITGQAETKQEAFNAVIHADQARRSKNDPSSPARTARESVVRDYIATDRNDRRIAGPSRDRDAMKRAADHAGGVVKFVPSGPRRAPPAPSSYPMFREGYREVAGKYLTRTGKVGAIIYKSHSRGHGMVFSYTGEWGAGSGLSGKDMQAHIDEWLRQKRGVQIIVPFAHGEGRTQEAPTVRTSHRARKKPRRSNGTFAPKKKHAKKKAAKRRRR